MMKIWILPNVSDKTKNKSMGKPVVLYVIIIKLTLLRIILYSYTPQVCPNIGYGYRLGNVVNSPVPVLIQFKSVEANVIKVHGSRLAIASIFNVCQNYFDMNCIVSKSLTEIFIYQ